MARPFKYREAILALLQDNPIHPAVDWIHVRLRQMHPRVSLATVYRTLRTLVAEGILCELPFGTSEARFGLIKAERHYHFICDACHKILDLSCPKQEGLEKAVQAATGHQVKRHTVEFYGRCRDCISRSPSGSSVKPDSGNPKRTNCPVPKGKNLRQPSGRKERTL